MSPVTKPDTERLSVMSPYVNEKEEEVDSSF